MFQLTIEAGPRTKTFTGRGVDRVIVDSTGQPKATAHHTGAHLHRKVHAVMVLIAKTEAVHLHHSYSRTVKASFNQHARYAKAKGFKRARPEQKCLRVCTGRFMRHVANRLSNEAYNRHKWTFPSRTRSSPRNGRTRGRAIGPTSSA